MKNLGRYWILLMMLLCGVYAYADSVDIILVKPESKFWSIHLLKNDVMIPVYDTVLTQARCTGDSIVEERQEAFVPYTKMSKGKYTLRYINIFGQHFDKSVKLTCSNYIYPDNELPNYECLSEWKPGEEEKYDTSAPISSMIKRGDTVLLAAYHGGCFGGHWEHTEILFADSVVDLELREDLDSKDIFNVKRKTSTYIRAKKYLEDFEKSGIGRDRGNIHSTSSISCYLILNNRYYISMRDNGYPSWGGYRNLLVDFRLKMF